MTEASALARKLTTHQKAVLIQVLLAFPEQRVAIEHAGAGDAGSYARDFLTIFNAVEWDVAELGVTKAALSDGSSGLTIVVREKQDVPPSAEALRDALRIYGIEVGIDFDSTREIADGEFILSVRANPQ
jgi:hypothetical protein